MSLYTEWVRYGDDASIGYLCHPERARLPLPAVLVLQEAWGVEAHIEDVTRRFAAAGYAAFAPDLYAQDGTRPPALTRERVGEMLAFLARLPPAAFSDEKIRGEALAKLPQAEGARIEETRGAIMGDMVRRDHVPRARGAVRYLREQCPASRGQKVGAVGFCMGGGLSALLACHEPELSAAVVFYGSAPPEDLVPSIRCPVLGLYGATDQRINAGIAAFEAAMAKHAKRFQKHVYEGAGHSFFNDTRPSYDVGAARDAFVRTLEHFRSTLL